MPAHSTFSDDRLAALERELVASFESGGMVGGAVSVWEGERERFHLALGSTDREGRSPWTDETLAPVFSCTKGPAAAACLHALRREGIPLERPVTDVWPAFGSGGKEGVTIAEVLSHQGGLAALDLPARMDDHAAVVAALERQRPLWRPGEGHGYHPRTFGFLVDEILRRVTGASSLGNYWREELADPLGWDVWIGLPAAEEARVATIYPARIPERQSVEEAPFYRALTKDGSLTARAFSSPQGWRGVRELNRPDAWRVGNAAMGGLASARGLAAFYATLASGGALCGSHLL